jgi:gamma-polyglutamate biosynthesis protein CapC
MFLPQGGLAISVASTVWVGATIVCLMNLFLGWSLRGLVVPGFLVPIFILMPGVAVINVIEGALAYLIVKIISSKLIYYEKIDNLFGRERYFAIILTAVSVRLISDRWILPHLADFLQSHYNYRFDFYANLNSYGIVIVALIANQFWREGFLKSIVPLAFTIFATYLIVRYGLMEIGAFRISQIETLYSNIGEIFDNSAKSYIILITTTLIAIRLTMRYGWDYGGMLVVGLLAIQWYSPARIGTTLLESIVIYLVGSFILKQNFVAKYNIIGAKQILLFFNIGFIYRILIGNNIMLLFPEERIIEYYGFGYLISTLIAMQIYKDGSVIRSVFMIIWTSFLGFVAGSIIALFLYFISGSYEKKIIPLKELHYESSPHAVSEQTGYLVGAIESYKDTMSISAKMPIVQPKLEEILSIDHFILKPLSDIVLYTKSIDGAFKQKLSKLNSYAANFGYELVLFNDLFSGGKFIFLAPIEQEQGSKNWGLYIFRLNSYNDQILQVPKPFDEVNSLGFAIFLFQRVKSGFLFIGGTYSDVNQDRSSDLTRPTSKASLYGIVNQVFLREHHYNNLIIQIRGYGLSIDSKAKPDSDVLVAFADGAIRDEQLTGAERDLIKIINDQGLSYRLVNGDEQTVGYEVGELFLSRYLVQTSNKDLGVIWLSPQLRKNFTDPANNYSLLSYYNILDVDTVKDSLSNFLDKSNIIYNWQPPEPLVGLLNDYIKSNDIVVLQNIIETSGYKVLHLILIDDGRDYLTFFDSSGNLLGIASMRPQVEEQFYSIIDVRRPRIDLSLKRWVNFQAIEGKP